VVLNQGRADVLTETLGNGRMALPLHICEDAIDKVDLDITHLPMEWVKR
jgi:hypothetical protein